VSLRGAGRRGDRAARRNGVGKTTLLKTLMGLVPAARGRIASTGATSPASRPTSARAPGIGYVPQGREIFPR
jgi:urea transport system ATP-binding protein